MCTMQSGGYGVIVLFCLIVDSFAAVNKYSAFYSGGCVQVCTIAIHAFIYVSKLKDLL